MNFANDPHRFSRFDKNGKVIKFSLVIDFIYCIVCNNSGVLVCIISMGICES